MRGSRAARPRDGACGGGPMPARAWDGDLDWMERGEHRLMGASTGKAHVGRLIARFVSYPAVAVVDGRPDGCVLPSVDDARLSVKTSVAAMTGSACCGCGAV